VSTLKGEMESNYLFCIVHVALASFGHNCTMYENQTKEMGMKNIIVCYVKPYKILHNVVDLGRILSFDKMGVRM
jgi:hypothetical protein